jgi:HK97 gp10 family phage protein
MAKSTGRWRGLDEALRRVTSLKKSLEPEKVEAVLMKGARVVKNEVHTRAPEGPTGRLKKAVKAKKGRRNGRVVTRALAAVDRKIAPHADLVERGTRFAPAKPYFRPGVVASHDRASDVVDSGLKQLLERGGKG